MTWRKFKYVWDPRVVGLFGVAAICVGLWIYRDMQNPLLKGVWIETLDADRVYRMHFEANTMFSTNIYGVVDPSPNAIVPKRAEVDCENPAHRALEMASEGAVYCMWQNERDQWVLESYSATHYDSSARRGDVRVRILTESESRPMQRRVSAWINGIRAHVAAIQRCCRDVEEFDESCVVFNHDLPSLFLQTWLVDAYLETARRRGVAAPASCLSLPTRFVP